MLMLRSTIVKEDGNVAVRVEQHDDGTEHHIHRSLLTLKNPNVWWG